MLTSVKARCIPRLQAPASLRHAMFSTALGRSWPRVATNFVPLTKATVGNTRISLAPAVLATLRSFRTTSLAHQHQQPQHGRTSYANIRAPPAIAAEYYDLTNIPTEAEREQILRDFILVPGYLSESEQAMMMEAATKKLKRALGKQVRYEDGHFDGVITRYRECSATDWGMATPEARPERERSTAAQIIGNIKHEFFPAEWQWVAPHILELEEGRGGIKPHVDHLEASGEVVAGLCLGSTAVMELIHETNPNKYFRVLLPKGCFYFQRDSVRYGYKHGIPIELEDHNFRGKVYPKDKRISVMLRNVYEKKAP